jgi:glycosyltransferase involved in cell wall biosynthesis
MLANFFNSSSFRKENRISFTFRENPVYERGFSERIRYPVDTSHVKLYDIQDWYAKADRFQSVIIRKMFKIILNLALLKYIFIVINTIILYRFFRELLKQRQVDILHINNGGYPRAYSSISAVLAADMAGIGTIVYVVNNIAAGYHNPERWLDYPFDIMVRKKVTVFVTGSHYGGNALRRTLSLNEERVVTINNGIAVQPITETRDQVASRYHFPSGRIIIAIIANLEERKGHIFLLKALKKMKDSGLPTQMPFLAIIAGPGNQRETMEVYIHKNNLENDVAFYPFEPKLSNLLNAVDIIVLPSIALEDFPNIVLDAMAAGKVVLASRFSGIREQIIDGESGILFPPADSDAIAAAIITLWGDENFRKRLGDAAKRSYSERFTVERAVNSYQELYSRLISEKRTMIHG